MTSSIIEQVLEWSKEVFLPFGELGLFIVSFLESSVFPIPVDVLLIPMSLVAVTDPQSIGIPANIAPFVYAGIASTASVLGGIAGYYLGKKGGRPIAMKLFSKKRVEKVESYFARYGAWAVLAAGFTPIPYKVFTITSGIVKLDLKKFVAASIAGRSIRFFAVSAMVWFWGEEIFKIIKEFEIYALVLGVGIIAASIALIRIRKK